MSLPQAACGGLPHLVSGVIANTTYCGSKQDKRVSGMNCNSHFHLQGIAWTPADAVLRSAPLVYVSQNTVQLIKAVVGHDDFSPAFAGVLYQHLRAQAL